MEMEWMFLAASTVILWLPATWLYPASGKDWLADTHRARFRLERMLETWQHWFDLIRALGGTFFLTTAVVGITGEVVEGDHWEPIAIGGILAAGVAFQTVHYRKDFYFTAPIFYLWGITLILVDWPVAVFSILFSAVLGRLADQVELKLLLMGGLVGVAGYLISGFRLNLVIVALLAVLPVIIAVGSQKHLVSYSRDLAMK